MYYLPAKSESITPNVGCEIKFSHGQELYGRDHNSFQEHFRIKLKASLEIDFWG